jgi:hypothetical protein
MHTKVRTYQRIEVEVGWFTQQTRGFFLEEPVLACMFKGSLQSYSVYRNWRSYGA